MEEKKITIFDVAEKAGVSKGTVDRVLHNRGEVSPKSAEKVRKAIEELNYEPNLYASLLATRKNRVIACVLPKYTPGEYWQKIHEGFEAGGELAASLNVGTSVFFYDQYDAASFREACSRMIESKPSGVVLPPLFKNDAMEIAGVLKDNDIPYVYVDTKLEDGNYFAYFGMPMYKSGYLCASLLTDRCTPEQVDEVLIVRIRRDKSRQSDPTINRRAGFSDFMDANFPQTRIHTVFIDPSDPASIEPTMSAFFAEHPRIGYVVMFSSRVHLIAPSLAANPCPGRRVIGFDDLDGNIEAVKQGQVTILISQHTADQSRLAVSTLTDYILMHKVPANRDCYMHMDILTRLNIENY
ncbi:MAG: substrate-binding domain-containing protein [Candidatus Cryptobacteroides sp.]